MFFCVCVIKFVLYLLKYFGNLMKMVRVLYFLLDKNICIKRKVFYVYEIFKVGNNGVNEM